MKKTTSSQVISLIFSNLLKRLKLHLSKNKFLSLLKKMNIMEKRRKKNLISLFKSRHLRRKSWEDCSTQMKRKRTEDSHLLSLNLKNNLLS